MAPRHPFLDLKALHASIRPELDEAIARVLAHQQFIGGPEVAEFECDFAGWCGARFAAGMSSGTTALTAILAADGIGPGDEVVVPSHTFIATVESIVETGATPVFADIDADAMTLDPDSAAAALSHRTAAIVAVHLYGSVGRWGALEALAAKHGLALYEDAAQAHGAEWTDPHGRTRRAGTLGRAAAFSFFPGKNLGAFGDAGAIATNDEALGRKAKMWANHGRVGKYDHEFLGVNARLDALQAAILRAKLPHLDQWNAARRRVAAEYAAAFEGTPVRMQLVPPTGVSAWHLLVVRTPVDRDALRERLAARGVATGIHYPVPCHRQPACAHLAPAPVPLDRTEAAAAAILSLPMCPMMAEGAAREIAGIVLEEVSGLDPIPNADSGSSGNR